jgi:hypothetical protein
MRRGSVEMRILVVLESFLERFAGTMNGFVGVGLFCGGFEDGGGAVEGFG